MGKKIKKVWKKIDPLRGGDKLLEKVGLPTIGDFTGEKKQEAAAKQHEQQMAMQRSQMQQQQQQLRDQNTDLSLENVVDVRAGDAAQSQGTGLKKRKRGALSSALGINV